MQMEDEDSLDTPRPLGGAAPDYPPGCRICLCDSELSKLGLDGDLPDIGDLLHMQVMGKVTFASKHETGGTRVELVLMLMKVEDEDRE